ncbi:hypothetical protein BV898_00430 [Hypsibius exemplaris]|uniref:Uncharacterized protein n=1 Tax=Hypsibius exemplaris TaxID=2072580 RepID=A0A1W0XDD1_HYPEX|nr:hypothetical protein BV898_00430 [Hypsibius exemplaris]
MVKARVAAALSGPVVGNARVPQDQRIRSLAQRYEVSKMLFLCFSWFLVTYFPNTIAGYAFFSQYRGQPHLVLILKGLQSLASPVNTQSVCDNCALVCCLSLQVLFIATSKKYRLGILHVLQYYFRRAHMPVKDDMVLTGSQPGTARANLPLAQHVHDYL